MASLLPVCKQQLSDMNGVPLPGGLLYTYAAGTTTPLAAYTDSTGATAHTNPIVLDAGGFAGVWLGPAAYKIVLKDALGVGIWTVDNVSAVSLADLVGNTTLDSLHVTGNATIDGNATVGGTLTAGTLASNGAATIAGALTAASATVNGNASITGALNVTGDSDLGTVIAGAVTVDSLTVGIQSLADLILATIPAVSAVSGALVISELTASGSWIIFTFGGTVGTRIQIAFGSGSEADGSSITLPTGFSSGAFKGIVSMADIAATVGNQLGATQCSLSGLVVTATGNDNSGHTYTGTANWLGVCWLTGF